MKNENHSSDDKSTVVAYGRFSSDHQRPTSIDDQVTNCKLFADRRQSPTPGRIMADEGVSVKDGMAPNFLLLLDQVRAGLVTEIYVDELSRISRVTEDILRVQRILRFYGVRLWCVHENIDITADDADIHVIFSGHKNQVASRDARHRVRKAMNGNMRRGLSNGDIVLGITSVALTDAEAAQLGLTSRGKDGRPYKPLVVDPAGAATVQMIFRMFVVDCMTIRAISNYLTKNNIPRGGKARKKRWRPIDVRKVLSNRRYLGYRTRNQIAMVTNPDTGKKTSRPQPKSELIEEFDPNLAIIDQATFDAAQGRLEEYRKKYAERRRNAAKRSAPLMTYAPRQLLAGTLECGECGVKMVQKYNGQVPYYVCPNAADSLCTNTVQVRRDLVHQTVLDAIREEAEPVFVADRVHELVELDLKSRCGSSANDLKTLQGRREEVVEEIGNLTSALAKRPDSEAVYKALDDREEQRRQLDAQIREAQRLAAAPCQQLSVDWIREQLDRGLEHLLGGNVGRAASLLRAITGPIRVFPGQKPWLRVRYPIIQFNLDFTQMATAAAADCGEWHGDPLEGGLGVCFELEIRKPALYETYAQDVVRLRDQESLGWPAIRDRLPTKMSLKYIEMTYRFGKTGDIYGHRGKSNGELPARKRRTKSD